MPASRTDTDERFVALVTAAADDHAERLLGGVDGLLDSETHHRAVMAAARALIACAVHPRSRLHRSEAAARAALRLVRHLAGMRGPDGLFDAENLASPPDTAFTVNDLCDAYALAVDIDIPALREAASEMERIALSARGALLRGGLHTPNHRWELCAALARLNRHWPDPRAIDRIDQWLAEGVDIDDDGMYSERSANYALHVSNPSLTVLGVELDRPELLDAVRRNLEAVWATTLPDLTVETVHSRRQDQRGSVGLAGFLMQLRRFAIADGRGDFAGAVERLLDRPIADPAGALTEILLEPRLAGPLPPAEAKAPVRAVLAGSGLAVVRDGDWYASVYGGSDYAAHRRVRSGLATNPTFLRVAAGEAVLDAVRLSRDFFGVGPFRSEVLEADGDGFVLRETARAAYYGPLPEHRRRPDGRYALADEGRFSASMDFAHRSAEDVALETRMRLRVETGEVRVACEAAPARVRQSLELTFRPGGHLSGVTETGPGTHRPTEATFTYRNGGDGLEITAHGLHPEPTRGQLAYHPGEDYTHLSGTDAADGPKVHLPVGPDGRITVVIREI